MPVSTESRSLLSFISPLSASEGSIAYSSIIHTSDTLKSCVTGAVGLIALLLLRSVFNDWRQGVRRNGFGRSPKSTSREGVNKINDSVYELYAPHGVPEVEIVFFHGLQPFDYKDAYWRTWRTNDPNSDELWPQTWIPRDFEKARILTVSYDSTAHQGATHGQIDMYLIAENLMHDLILSPAAHVGQSANCPVILVGHSLGGLVIKKAILHAKSKLDQQSQDEACNDRDGKRLKSFFHSVKGIFYFATPHNGSRMADLKQMTDLLMVLPQNSEVLKFLAVLNKEAARMNDDFRVWRQNNNIQAATVFETLPTIIWFLSIFPLFKGVVVEEGAARFDSDRLMGAHADHIGVCKPKDRHTSSYQFLTNFIADCAGIELTSLSAQEEALLI